MPKKTETRNANRHRSSDSDSSDSSSDSSRSSSSSSSSSSPSSAEEKHRTRPAKPAKPAPAKPARSKSSSSSSSSSSSHEDERHVRSGKTSYHFFCDKERKKVRKERPDWKMSDVQRELGRRWNALDDKKKRVFARQAERARHE